MLGALAAAAVLLLVLAPAAMAQAGTAPQEDHSKDAQLIALGVLVVISLLLLVTGGKVKVTTKQTKYTDAAGTEHTLQQGWRVPHGATVPNGDVKEKRISAFRQLYLGTDNRASTSKAVALAWTYALVYALVSLLVAKWMGSQKAWDDLVNNDLQEEYLLLLGGPYAAAVIAKYTAVAASDSSEKTTEPAVGTPADDVKNLVVDDAGDADVGDFQYVLFNLVALAYVLGSFIPHLLDGLPDLPATLTGLALTSAGGYSAKKAAERAAGAQLTSVFPGSVAKGGTIEVWGRNLLAPGAAEPKPLVSIDDLPAASVDVLSASTAADRLKVTVPTTVNAGADKKVKVTTATGAPALTPGGADHLTVTVT
jgi:hypothetical protein